jgi:hypothetical protein
MPGFPALVLMTAALPMLWPRAGVRLPERFPRVRLRRVVPPWPAIGAAAAVLGVAPLVLISVARIHRPDVRPGERLVSDAQAAKFFIENIYLPLSNQVHLTVHRDVARGVERLSWTSPPTHGTKVFFRVFRSPTNQIAFQGNPPQPGDPSLPHGHYGVRCLPLRLAPNDCRVEMNVDATTRAHQFAEGIGRGDWTFRIGMSANYANDPTLGDVLILSPPARVIVR